MSRSPTHAGGLFAINRNYFLELGAYDPGLLVWGGENFELSFKVSITLIYIYNLYTNINRKEKLSSILLLENLFFYLYNLFFFLM